MNYAVMYEYAVDRNSGQFKAPVNQIANEARVFTYKDTTIVTPNSDTPQRYPRAGSQSYPFLLVTHGQKVCHRRRKETQP